MNKLKIEKEMPEFVAEVAGLSVDDLNLRLSRLAKDYEAVEEAKEADEGLAEAKEADEGLAEAREAAKEMAAPYREGKKAIRMKSSYIVALVKEKGGE